jgi:hypothetical protein
LEEKDNLTLASWGSEEKDLTTNFVEKLFSLIYGLLKLLN